MRTIAIACALLTGCATTWGATQIAGMERGWDEGVREVTVPTPGVREQLSVSLPLGVVYEANQLGVTKPFALECTTRQYATDTVHHSAFRYGKRWKLITGVSALIEGALATAIMLERANVPAFDFQTSALRRAFVWLHDQAKFPAVGNDTWQPHVINFMYGTTFPAPVPSQPGKIVGFTDWTHR